MKVTNENHYYPEGGYIIEVDNAALEEIRAKWNEVTGWATGSAYVTHPDFKMVMQHHNNPRSILVYLRSNTNPKNYFLGSLNRSYKTPTELYVQG